MIVLTTFANPYSLHHGVSGHVAVFVQCYFSYFCQVRVFKLVTSLFCGVLNWYVDSGSIELSWVMENNLYFCKISRGSFITLPNNMYVFIFLCVLEIIFSFLTYQPQLLFLGLIHSYPWIFLHWLLPFHHLLGCFVLFTWGVSLSSFDNGNIL